ncbi:MAG: sensor histidine kinase [Nitrospirae bacterium]|nr:sensor histidine kinase [Nitrospirota bacterium]MDE3217843.1 sensor histidine kinase [Nitrospirota bacterium]
MNTGTRQGFIATGVAASTVVLFVLDLHTPLAMATHVLYIVPVLLALFSPHRWFPVTVAAVVTILTAIGGIWSPRSYDIPFWIPLVNHMLSGVVIWMPVWYFSQRRKHEEELQRLNEALDRRVQVRTRELASVNESLVAEVAERMQTEQSLESSRQELQQLASRLLCVQEEERRRISRDLHDDINQRLALLAMEIEAVEHQLSSSPVHVGRAVRAIQDRVVELSEDVRHLAYQFHPSILDDLGLSIALQRLVDDFTVRSNVRGSFGHNNIPGVVPQEIATCLYRVAQESLNNVARHAQASRVDVELTRSQSWLTVTITDDGVGFASEQAQNGRHGLGLLSMKERVALVHGALQIISAVGMGTKVQVVVPVLEEEE